VQYTVVVHNRRAHLYSIKIKTSRITQPARYNGINVHIRFHPQHNQLNCFRRIVFDATAPLYMGIGFIIYLYSHLFIIFRLSADNVS